MAVATAEVVLPCTDLDSTLDYFTDRLGFRVATIWPADEPRVAVLVGHGFRLRLDKSFEGAAGELRFGTTGSHSTETAPNGTRCVFEPAEPPLDVPEAVQELVVSGNDDGSWGVGRAGMRYRDLLPGRHGGRFIASHIHIPVGGPVPDYVHYHHIRFQLIFVRSGWVRVVYEDQGESFVMEAGDCVLQPPLIRHQVLESSDDLEVIEIGCPALHQTNADHELSLPTGRVLPERDFGGQRFVRHIASETPWGSTTIDGFERRDTGIGAATDGLAEVGVVRLSSSNAAPSVDVSHDGEFLFLFVLAGEAELVVDGSPHQLANGVSVTIPAGVSASLDPTPGVEFLEVRL